MKKMIGMPFQRFIKQTQLAETYRVINYYQGKLSQSQKICKQYQQNLLPSQPKRLKNNNNLKVDNLLQKLRSDNVELRGQLQKKNYEINKITAQLRRVQFKYFNNQQKIIQLNKKISAFKNNNNNNQIIGTQKQKIKTLPNNYQRQNLLQKDDIDLNEGLIKRRPGLYGLKNRMRSRSGEDNQHNQDIHSEYKKNIYIKQRQERNSSNNSRLKLKNKQKQIQKQKQKQKISQYFQLSKNNNNNKQKKIISQNKIIQNNKDNNITILNINFKLKTLQKQLQNLKKQNQELHLQLDNLIKSNIIQNNNTIQVKQQIKNNNSSSNSSNRKQYNSIQKQKQSKKIMVEKNKLKQIPKHAIQQLQKGHSSQVKLSNYVSNVSPKLQRVNQQIQIKNNHKKTYRFKRIQDRTLRMLIINIARNDLTYLNLINKLTELWMSENFQSLTQFLQESPCSLSPKETSQFINEYHEIMRYIQSKQNQTPNKDMNVTQYKKLVQLQIKTILKDNIQYFKNITIRKDYSLNIQLSNKFKNYEEQIQQLNRLYRNRMNVDDGKKILIGKWGLSNEEFLFFLIRNKEEYDDIQYIHFEDMAKYFMMV